MVPTRRSVKISSRNSAFGSTLMSLVVSGLVAIGSVRMRRGRKHELPAAGTALHVGIVGRGCGAVVPVLRRRHHRRRRIVCRRIVIARPEVRGPRDEASADEDAGAAMVEMMPMTGMRPAAAAAAAAAARFGIERDCRQ